MLISQCFKAKTLDPDGYIGMISFLPTYSGKGTERPALQLYLSFTR